MTLPPSRPYSSSRVTGGAALDHEILQERATALGRLGRALQTALVVLAEHQRQHGAANPARERLVAAASEALWCFIVQRESVGLRDWRQVIQDYCVPAEVRDRMGVVGRRA